MHEGKVAWGQWFRHSAQLMGQPTLHGTHMQPGLHKYMQHPGQLHHLHSPQAGPQGAEPLGAKSATSEKFQPNSNTDIPWQPSTTSAPTRSVFHAVPHPHFQMLPLPCLGICCACTVLP